jgi:hypothetical protein
MGLSNQAVRLEEYLARVEQGDANRIMPSDVDRIIAKLERKRQRLLDRMGTATSPAEADRHRRKIVKADELIDRARWLRSRL